ncbi:hypothetical protein C8R44DRAFT_244871 [Mycena epipterygia]|nr:hypothetical protein C8R44DRAFT_244871 [Mycena epipterygia]
MTDALITTDTLGVQEETVSLFGLAAELDIHDVNRKKIIIRPRLKEYVSKQRSLGTLACFTPAIPKTAAPKPKSRDTSASARPPPTKSRAMVASGRIEKSPRSPPRKVHADFPMDAASVVALPHYELYSCGCSSPSQCRQCTLHRLADEFCAIVTARKERIRQNETSAMFS